MRGPMSVAEAPSLDRAVLETGAPLLRLNNVEVIYDRVILVLKGLSLEVPRGKIVALLGANGAGKSTTLKAISGLLKSEDGEVTDGTIELEGQPIQNRDPAEIVGRGVFQVMEGRRVFEHLTVEENLRAGAHTRGRQGLKEDIEMVYRYFPRLLQRRTGNAGYLSGGEQQMLAIGRALMARPRLLLLDEPSLGLAPLLVEVIFETLIEINRQGVTVLLVEQNAHMALAIAHRGYVLETGTIVLADTAANLQQNEEVQKAYLGIE